MTAERANQALARIVDWYNRGGYWIVSSENDQDPLPVSAFTLLVKEWLRTGTAAGTVRAAELLVTWTEGQDAISLLGDHKEDIVDCFNETLEQFSHL